MKEAAVRKPRRASDEALWASRQEEILETAAKLFAKHGYADTDTQLLADELGVGKGTLYRYFTNKQALFLAAADRVMRQLRQHIDSSIAEVTDPLERIVKAVAAYLAFFEDHPECVELLMQERAQFKDRKKPTFFEHREANVQRWQAVYRGLIAEGRIRDMPVERITDVMSHVLYGTIFTNYFTGQHKPSETQARDILDVVFRGILSDSERAAAETG
jgi:AcrR family transcriptional regulator